MHRWCDLPILIDFRTYIDHSPNFNIGPDYGCRSRIRLLVEFAENSLKTQLLKNFFTEFIINSNHSLENIKKVFNFFVNLNFCKIILYGVEKFDSTFDNRN